MNQTLLIILILNFDFLIQKINAQLVFISKRRPGIWTCNPPIVIYYKLLIIIKPSNYNMNAPLLF